MRFIKRQLSSVVFFLFLYSSIGFTQSYQEQCDSWRSQIDTITDLDVAMLYSKSLLPVVDTTCQAELYIHCGNIFNDKMELDSALFYIEKGIQLAKRIAATELMIYGLIKKASAYIYQGDLTSSQEYVQRAKHLLISFPDSEHWIHYYNVLSKISDKTSDYELSVNYLDSCILHSFRLKDSLELSTIYHNKGLTLLYLSDYPGAAENLIRSLELRKQLTGKEASGTHFVLGTCYHIWKQYDKAIHYLKKGTHLAKEEKSEYMLVQCYNALANANRKLDFQDRAMSYLDSASIILETQNLPDDLAKVLLQKGLIYYHHYGQLERAEQFFSRAYDAAQLTDNDVVLFSASLVLVNLHTTKKEIKKARQQLFKVKTIAERAKTAEFYLEYHKAAQELYEKTNSNDKALYHLKEYTALKDSVANNEVLAKIADLEKKYDTKEKELNIVQLTKEKEMQKEITKRATFRQYIFSALAAILFLFMIFGTWVYSKLRVQQVALTKAHKELSEINQVKNHLFSIIAHDLRGMIIPFQRASRILGYHIDKGNVKRTLELTSALEKNAQDLSDMLDNLLQWSLQQMEGYQYTPITFSVIGEIQNIFSLFSEQATHKNISLEIETILDLTIEFDKDAFHVIFRNLIGNAIKFTESGSVKISWKQSGRGVDFYVKDTGIGIKNSELDTLLTLKPSTRSIGTSGEKGTGLGLNLVQQFVVMHNGNIEVNSKKGKGTTFILNFPGLLSSPIYSS